MTIKQGFEHFLRSEDFNNYSAQQNSLGAKLRIYRKRFKEGVLKEAAMISVLKKYGYTIEVKKPNKKIQQKPLRRNGRVKPTAI